tara:strand:+ start:352 stop:930 length:579 start_codon:yes stop_codon:yes gene_type:complete
MTKIGGGSAVVVRSLFQEEGSGSIPTSPLQFSFVEIPMREACMLNKTWHSMLPRTDLGNMLCGSVSAAYAAEFDGRQFAVALFSQPIIRAIAKDGVTIELRRLAICDEAPKNTASRMLSICCKMIKAKYPQMIRVVSYLAVDVHQGTIYKAANWKPVGQISAARPQRKRGDYGRATGPLQTTSRKQRWEKTL